jgi:hypothetical protein
MFGFDQSTEAEKVSRMPAGINENVRIVKVVKEKKKENVVLSFYFADKYNSEFTHSEFQPDPTKENFEKKLGNLSKRVKHIVSKFVPEDKQVLKAATWDEFCDSVSALFDDSTKDARVRIKLVLNDAGFTSFTPYTGFIEEMSVNPTRLRIGQNERTSAVTPDANGGAGATDDLPF